MTQQAIVKQAKDIQESNRKLLIEQQKRLKIAAQKAAEAVAKLT